MQSIPDTQGDFSILSRDLFHDISLYLPNKDLYNLMQTEKELHRISSRYLRPTQEDLERSIEYGDIKSVQKLTEHRVITNEDGVSQKIIPRYSGIDPGDDDNHAIRRALILGFSNILEFLLSRYCLPKAGMHPTTFLKPFLCPFTPQFPIV